jgi:uncharacterized membrane protein YcaP (DUF421 family)
MPHVDWPTLWTNLVHFGAFDSATHPVSLLEKIVRPVVVYLILVFALRTIGKRVLAQLNPFDFVVLITLSNTVQNAIIGDDNSLLGGMIGGATLIALNLAVNWYLYRHPDLDRRIEGEPLLLVKDGQLLRHNLKHELITEQELLSMVHRQGVDSFAACSEVILETSGVITVLARQPTPEEVLSQEIVVRLDRIERLLSERRVGAQGEASSG